MRRPLQSFRGRLLLLVGGLVVLAQAATFAGILNVLDADVRAATKEQLDRASEQVARLMAQRAELLGNGADVLVADFGFRTAIGSGDRETIRSALENNATRIGADVVVLHAPDGRAVIANAKAMAAAGGLPPSISGDDPDRRADHVAPLGELAWQSVVVPVRAPETIARLSLGFALDHDIASEFARQLDMQVSFGVATSAPSANGEAMDWHHPVTAAHDRAPVLDPTALDALPNAPAASLLSLGGESFLARTLTLANSDGRVRIVLQRSLADALAPYYTLRDRMLVITTATLLIGLLAAAWLAHGLSRPLALLRDAARRVSAGRYDLPSGIVRDDEIGELASTFDTMASTIAEREARITHLATHDEITGLANRRHGTDHLQRTLTSTRGDGDSLTVAVVGIDELGRVADTLGQSVAEAVVTTVAARLSDSLRPGDAIARIGDELFSIVMPDTSEAEASALLPARLADAAAPLAVGEAELVPTLSVGLVVARGANEADGAHAEALIQRAGIALADAREANVTLLRYRDGRDETLRRQLSIIADLKRAVDEDELLLHFQPKVSTRDGEVRSVEALVRWIHPEHGFMPPDEFITLAERSGNVALLSNWVIDRAARQARRWRAEGRHLSIAINLSALDLRDPTLARRIASALNDHALPSDALVVEVTETAVIDDPALALSTLDALRSAGTRVSIDDFGTGQSSLAKLRELPADELKIDRAFISGLRKDTPQALIVRAIAELGHGLGMTLIAEGVETEDEAAVVRAIGIDAVQGYLHSRPLLPDALGDWLDTRNRSEAA